MDIKDILVSARSAVDEAEIDESLRAIAFEKAIEFLMAGAWAKSPVVNADDPPLPVGAATSEVSRLQRLVDKLKVELDVVDQIYAFDGDKVEVTVSPRRLKQGMAAATRELALLVAAGRQGADLEEWTPVDAIRDVCQRYRRYDGPNFAGALKALDNDLQFRGPSTKREVRVSRPGWESAADLIRRIVNGAES